jgi:hypothetical protein
MNFYYHLNTVAVIKNDRIYKIIDMLTGEEWEKCPGHTGSFLYKWLVQQGFIKLTDEDYIAKALLLI